MKYIWILLMCFVVGCGTFRKPYENIPLASGNSPYVLPPATYIDSKGLAHKEEQPRWSMSEKDVFNTTMAIPEQIKKGLFEPKDYILFSFMGLLLILVLRRYK